MSMYSHTGKNKRVRNLKFPHAYIKKRRAENVFLYVLRHVQRTELLIFIKIIPDNEGLDQLIPYRGVYKSKKVHMNFS